MPARPRAWHQKHRRPPSRATGIKASPRSQASRGITQYVDKFSTRRQASIAVITGVRAPPSQPPTCRPTFPTVIVASFIRRTCSIRQGRSRRSRRLLRCRPSHHQRADDGFSRERTPALTMPRTGTTLDVFETVQMKRSMRSIRRGRFHDRRTG